MGLCNTGNTDFYSHPILSKNPKISCFWYFTLTFVFLQLDLLDFFLQISNNTTTFPLSYIQYVVMYPCIQDTIQFDCRHILVGCWKHLNAPVSMQFPNTSVSGLWKLLQGQSHVIILDTEITPKLTVARLVSLRWREAAFPVIWTCMILLSSRSTYLIPDQSDHFEWESNVKTTKLFLSLQVHKSYSVYVSLVAVTANWKLL